MNRNTKLKVVPFLFLISFSLIAPAANVSAWTPDPKMIKGYLHEDGADITLSKGLLFTGVVNVRADLWKDEDSNGEYIISILVEDARNIYNKSAPEGLANDIEAYAEASDFFSANIDSIFNLLTDGIDIALSSIYKATFEEYFDTIMLSNSDYSFIDDGYVVYNTTTTFAIVRDQELAMLVFNIEDPSIFSSLLFSDAANQAVQEINTLVDTLFEQVYGYVPEGSSFPQRSKELPQASSISKDYINQGVLDIVEDISFQFGDNNANKMIAGYPIYIMGAIGLVFMIILLKKFR